MNHDSYPDHYLAEILRETGTIALVGASPKPERPSHRVMAFLLRKGYRVIPVNPGQAGRTILDQPVVARLGDIADPIDMVDVFRTPAALPALIEEILALPRLPKVVWGQLSVRDDAAAGSSWIAARRSNIRA
jgi:predicted CoA-binding protein